MTITLQCRSAPKKKKRKAAVPQFSIQKIGLVGTTTQFPARNDILQ